jgi:chitinase
MGYDVWGFSWTTSVGPNAPLNDSCAVVQDQKGSLVSALKAWTSANVPTNQIVLGVPSYGHSYLVTPANALVSGTNQLESYPPFNTADQPQGDSSDQAGGEDPCGNYEGVTGIFHFWGLVSGGYLTSKGTPAENIDARYDNCSRTASTHSFHQKAMPNDFF